MVGIFLFVLFFILLVIGIPIAFVIAIVALAGIATVPFIPEVIVPMKMFNGLNSFVLLAVPLYILVANLMNSGKISQKLIDLSIALAGHVKGGLAYANVIVSMIFAGVSGAATADTAGLGKVLIPNMTETGYDSETAVAVTAVSSTIGILIPPSIPMIIYAGLTNTSVAVLFFAGMVPGILLGVGLMFVILLQSVKKDFPRFERADIRKVYKLIIESLPALLTPIIIIGGILTGWYTPTEAAAFASIYALFIGMFVYRTIKVKDFPEILFETLKLSSLSLFALATASALGELLSYYRMDQVLLQYLTLFITNRLMFVAFAIVFFIFIGTFMDIIPAMILFVPVLLPVAVSFGISAELFGLITVITLAIGLVTPPYGLCLLVASSIAHLPVGRAFTAMSSYILVILVVLLAVVFFPAIAFFVPNFFGV